MRYWQFYLEDNNSGERPASGYIRAHSPHDARDLIGHPEYNLIELPDDLEFPKKATGAIYWEVEPLVRTRQTLP